MSEDAVLKVLLKERWNKSNPGDVMGEPADNINGEQWEQDLGRLSCVLAPGAPCVWGRPYLSILPPEEISDESIQDYHKEDEDEIQAEGCVGGELHDETPWRT